MEGKFKHIIPIILIIIFLFPSWVKLVHHHHGEGHYRAGHSEKIDVQCEIRNYIAVFYPDIEFTLPDRTIILNTCNIYPVNEVYISRINLRSVLLRAPPVNNC